MGKYWTIPLTICILLFLTLGAAQSQTTQSLQDTIHILPDGTVTPSSTPIHQSGDFYQLTDNINAPIIIERNNITLNGKGFTIQGKGAVNGQAAINLTCMSVTVEDFQFKDWLVGVLGAYDGNRVVGNNFTDVSISIAVYANNYEITQNYLNYIRIQGSNIRLYENEIQIPNYRSGFWISNSTNVTVEANNVKMGDMITSFISVSGSSTLNVFHNNFFNADKVQLNKGQFYLFGMFGLSNVTPWDDGYPSGGNYWSDYTARYGNASAIGSSGIWDMKYVLQSDYNSALVDRYPFVNPYPVQVAALPTPPPAGGIEDNPTPSVPELPGWVMFMLLATTAFAMAGLKKKTKKEATSAESP